MSRKPRPVIDCFAAPDLLAGWPMADRVKTSQTALALMDDLDADWMLAAADLDGKGYTIDAEDMIITLDTGGLSKAAISRSHHFLNTLTLNTFAALRAAWQAERTDDTRDIARPDTWLLLSRVQTADIATLTLRMAFEARCEGDEALWRHVVGDDNGDMAISFAKHCETGADDVPALARMALQWFSKDSRVSTSDTHTLEYMDANIDSLMMEGQGQIAPATLAALTIDPLSGASYLGATVVELASNPIWRTIENPVIEAHYIQIMNDIGTMRMGAVSMRDKKLGARLFHDLLFPDLLVTA